MSPRYKQYEWEDESYDVVDFLIDNDPIELGAQMRRCERSLRTTLGHLRWTLMELGPEPPWTDPSPLLDAWKWLAQSENGLNAVSGEGG